VAPENAPRRSSLLRLEREGGWGTLRKVAAGFAGLFLFILALQALKKGAGPLGPFVVERLGVDSPVSAVGFGWLLAFVVLSGSPVAAIALSFFASGVLTAIQTFAMIAGSRFGAAFIVLLLGFFYTLRGKAKGRSLEMGVLSLLTTYVVYGIAIPIGALVLTTHALDGVHPSLPGGVFDFIELVYDPIVNALAARLAPIFLFLVGVGVILLAFHLFDKALPDLAKDSPVRDLEAHVYKPLVMFGLGCLVTLFTLSVSVSLGILVPLSAKGIARRENVIPYIMGANITTFVDTLFATLFLDRPEAFTIVLVEMISVAAVSLVILFGLYRKFETALLALSRQILATRARLATFIGLTLLVPILLLWL
jgi:solute carrier family 34 (sodium-dependent phosphate cotransporter)